MPTRIVVCYRHSVTGDQMYLEMDEGDLEAWCKSTGNPVTHVFRTESDLEARNTRIAAAFRTYCRRYGFEPDDIDATYRNQNGHAVKILGLNMSNTKYKFIVYDLTAGTRYKVTPQYAQALVKI